MVQVEVKPVIIKKTVKGSRGCADLSDSLILYDVRYPFFFNFMVIVLVGCCIHYVERHLPFQKLLFSVSYICTAS